MDKPISRHNLFVVIIASLLITHCAGTPDANPAMQKVETAYNEIENDSLVVNNATVELKEAKEAVNKARWLMRSGGNEAAIDKQLVIAQQRVEIARKAAELQAARDQVRRTSDELQALLQNRRQVDPVEKNKPQPQTEVENYSGRLTHFESEETDRGLVIRFQSGIFEPSKAYLKSNAAGAINELVDFLNGYPDRTVLVEGHTDNTGSKSLNQKLSQQRANAVREALVARDIKADRIRAVGLGEQYPRVSNKTEAGRAYNRRVEVILSDSSGTIPARE